MNEVQKDSQHFLFQVGHKVGLSEQNVKDVIYLFGTNALGENNAIREESEFGKTIRHTTPLLTVEVLRKAMDDEFIIALWNYAMNLPGTRGHGRNDQEGPKSLRGLKDAQQRLGDDSIIRFAKSRLKAAIKALEALEKSEKF